MAEAARDESVAAATLITEGCGPTGPYPAVLPDADEHVYARRGDHRLSLWVFPTHASEPRPAVVFFFGGGWASGTPMQFAAQARYLARRGITAVVADYRVSTRHRSTPADSVADAAEAMAWLRAQAPALGIDPTRIAAAGASAGGHLAACTMVLDLGPTSRPDALILFNPVLITDPPADDATDGLVNTGLHATIAASGVDPATICPDRHLDRAIVPTLILTGRADPTTPYRAAERFRDRAVARGAQCRLVGYDEQPHGFFNPDRDGGWAFVATLRRVDRFLAELGWLSGEPTLVAGA